MAVWGEAGGRFVGWGPVLSAGNPTDEKLGPTGELSGMFWLIGTAFALRVFLTITTLGGFTRVFRENCNLLVFGGVWALREIPGPNRQKKLTEKNLKKIEIFLFFVAVSNETCLRRKQSDFRDFFSFLALGAPF